MVRLKNEDKTEKNGDDDNENGDNNEGAVVTHGSKHSMLKRFRKKKSRYLNKIFTNFFSIEHCVKSRNLVHTNGTNTDNLD